MGIDVDAYLFLNRGANLACLKSKQLKQLKVNLKTNNPMFAEYLAQY